VRLGVDFDNTLVRYDEVFHRLAVERGCIPPQTPSRKEAVRDAMRAAGREAEWTVLQGHVYGPGMSEAVPFPGALDCLARCAQEGVPVWIISHRTLRPLAGPPHDLHAAARDWLERHGVKPGGTVSLGPDRVIFEETKAAKLARIRQFGCTHFIDDLPELLSDPAFPPGVERLWFDPYRSTSADARFERFTSWDEIERWIFQRTR
jgi:hypothetical protein